MSTVAVIGLGATGLATAKALGPETSVRYYDTNQDRMALGASLLDSATPGNPIGSGAAVVVLATPAGNHLALARRALAEGSSVVSMSDCPQDILGLLELDGLAKQSGNVVIVGAGMAPGLSCLLAHHAGNALDQVEEIAIAKTGTAGPACARQRHKALKTAGRDWLGGAWLMRRGSSGRELSWFPDPIGALDCYRGDLASPLLLQRVYPDAGRISARMSATRRDRLTYRLPMLRPPHVDGGPGGIRVEVRGLRDGAFKTLIYGVMAHPSKAAGFTCAAVAEGVGAGEVAPGAIGLGELPDPLIWLQRVVARGLKMVAMGDPI